MTKFKTGDLVKCIDNRFTILQKGSIYEVINERTLFRDLIKVKYKKEIIDGYFSHKRFELVKRNETDE